MRPIRVVRSDKNGERSVGLGGLHKLLAHDPALELAVPRGLKGRKHSRLCAELWGPSRPYKPTSRAHLGKVGWLGCEDQALWRGMGGGEGREVKEERGGGKHHHHPPPPPSPRPPPKKARAKPPPPPPPQSGSGSSRTRTPGPTTPALPLRRPPTKTPPQQQENPPPKSKAVPAPKEKGREKKVEGGGKEAGAAKMYPS